MFETYVVGEAEYSRFCFSSIPAIIAAAAHHNLHVYKYSLKLLAPGPCLVHEPPTSGLRVDANNNFVFVVICLFYLLFLEALYFIISLLYYSVLLFNKKENFLHFFCTELPHWPLQCCGRPMK